MNLRRAVVGVVLVVSISLSLFGQIQARKGKEPLVTKQAKGTFDVKLQPQTVTDQESGLQRYSLDKQFHGELEGSSKGEMLSAGNPTTGSAGYVAMEIVTGTLAGRSGSFALQHNGTLSGGKQQLSVTVVPGSGSGQLTGINGKMNIIVEGGMHSYVFDYALPAQ